MNYKTNKLRDAVLIALVAGSMSGTAFAQTATTTEQAKPATDKQLDQIVVTGSRIKSQTVTASSPVTEIDGEQFKLTGSTRVEDLVNQMPQMSPAFDSFNNNGATGYPTVDLRGLGTKRTLTLVNGNRLAPGAAFASDISIIPSSIIKRVDLLTGGASAVYGSDAVAGVVNFVLDDQFEGVSLSVGTSGYQHKNDNSYIQGLMNARGFSYPTGNTHLDGHSRNIDIAVGSGFADGAGHAMAWLTWRKNDALFEGQRDYSSCALNATGSGCGGSNTNAAGNFYIYQPATGTGQSGRLSAPGTWSKGYGAPYNYAPINYFQRPDRRYTFGAMANYKINSHFEPYIEMMFANKRDASQIAPSGAFFTDVNMNCSNPLLGNMCSTFGFDPTKPVTVYVAKRNIEGGPRHSDVENTQYRILAGLRGNLIGVWDYNMSYLYGRNTNTGTGINDFVNQRIRAALLGCDANGQYGTFPGCQLYNVWTPGGVTPAAAQSLAGTSLNNTTSSLTVLNAYISGNIGWGFPSAKNDPIGMVLGVERRDSNYNFTADSISQAGDFAGSGGKSLPLNGRIEVNELFAESAVPLVRTDGFLKSLGLDLGYRLSRYTNSQGNLKAGFNTNTWKVGFNSDFGMFRIRGGFNRAMRAPNVNELFTTQTVGLFSGADPCAGATPKYSAAQCANTGVTAAQYGNVAPNSASQYNALFGGNFSLKPEQANTWTLGLVLTPIKNLRVNVDYYDIKLTDAIGTVGAVNTLDICATSADPVACGKIHRGPGGTLYRTPNSFVVDTNNNVGTNRFRGVDLGAAYNWKMWGGNAYANFNGAYYLKRITIVSDPSSHKVLDNYDCAGKLNPSCADPKWRHIANVGWNGPVGVNLRWRYFGKLDYVDKKGNALSGTKGSDVLISPKGGLPGYNYFDLSLTYSWRAAEFVVGVNNILDKEPPMVGGTLTPSNANMLGGYDPAGRMFFGNVTFKF